MTGRPSARAAAGLLAFSVLLSGVLSAGTDEGENGPVVAEVVRWAEDAAALVKAPGGWSRGDWTLLGTSLAGTGGLMLGDREAYRWAVRNQTPSRDDAARFVSRFGAEYSIVLSVGYLAGGLAFGDAGVRDTGRDAIEASILTGLIVNVALKPGFGRERPAESDGAAVFRPFSSYASFPSGHTAQAFTVASVIAMRSDGWVAASAAYAVASLVAVSRVYQQAHFPSDTLAGAVLGVAVGRFVVGRHRPAPAGGSGVELEVVPLAGGLALHVSY